MKLIVLAIAMLSGLNGFSQSATEAELLRRSAKIFEWEVQGNIDSLENAFHEKFIVVSSDGSTGRKADYLKRLRSGDFVHNSIDIEENTAIVSDNTATVVGKGRFNVTASGNKISLHLSYIEVFTRENRHKPWKAVAMKASILEK